MALTTTILDGRNNDIIINQTVAVTAADNDVTGKAGTLYAVQVTNGSGEVAYVKLYDANGATDATVPFLVLMVVNGTTRTFVIPDGIAYSTGLCLRCVDTGGVAGTSTPSGGTSVGVQLVVS